MGSGRLKVSPDDYNPKWESEVLAGYKNGNSDVWVRVNCFKNHTVSSDLWYRWLDEEETFSGTIKRGHELCQAWWENVSKSHADGSNTDANATSLIFNMSNRFRETWKQRQTVEQTTKIALDIDEMDKLAEYLEENGVNTDDL